MYAFAFRLRYIRLAIVLIVAYLVAWVHVEGERLVPALGCRMSRPLVWLIEVASSELDFGSAWFEAVVDVDVVGIDVVVVDAASA